MIIPEIHKNLEENAEKENVKVGVISIRSIHSQNYLNTFVLRVQSIKISYLKRYYCRVSNRRPVLKNIYIQFLKSVQRLLVGTIFD